MKKYTVRVLCLLMIFAMFVSALAGCATGTTGDETSAEQSEAPAVKFSAFRLADAAAFMSENATPAEKGGVSSLSGALMGSDMIGRIIEWKTETDGQDRNLIIIGNTSRPESAGLSEGLHVDEWVVKGFEETGNIAVCAGSEEAYIAAVSALLEKIVIAENGDKLIPLDIDMKYTGTYAFDKPALGGTDISEFAIVIPAVATADDKYAAALITAAIKEYTGIGIETIKDTKADKSEKKHFIIIGNTSVTYDGPTLSDTDKDYSYVYGIAGDHAVIRGTDGATVYAARAFARAVTEGKTGEIGAAVKTAIEFPEYTAPAELGTMPVALTDQKNARITVADVAPFIAGGEAKITWNFAPTSSLGFNTDGYGERIDEAKLRYNEKLGTYVVLMTSSSGFVGMAEYPSGKCLWNVSLNGYGPHSIEYLPGGKIAVALSGNGDASKSQVRVYNPTQKNTAINAYDSFDSTHAVQWDKAREILWVYGSATIAAYEVGDGERKPTLEKLPYYNFSQSMGGHDMSEDADDPDTLWLCGNGVYKFSKSKLLITKIDALSVAASKSSGTFPGGTFIRTYATNVYASHDTDTLDIFVPDGNGGYTHMPLKFSGKAFYKGRVFLPQ